MSAELKSLIRAYADEEITPDQLQQLEQKLRADAAARDDFLHELNIHAALEDLAAGGDVQLSDNGSKPRTAVATWSFAVAVVAVIALVVTVVWPRSKSEVVTITGLSGEVKWTGDGGQVTPRLAIGQRLNGGALELLDAQSWVEFKFRDHSTVTLSGQTAVTISEQPQKELHLRYGLLSANIEPQPTGRPMFVHTQTAQLEVLGTQFNVAAHEETTKLTVNQGQVRLKRKTDGKEVNVPAEYQVIASIEDQKELVLRPRGASVFTWKSDLKSDVVHGKWVSALWMLGQKLKQSVVTGRMTREEASSAFKGAATFDDKRGSVWAKPSPVGALVVLSVSRPSTRVVIGAGAKLRIRGRLYSPIDVEFGFTTNKVGGGFAGKYSLSMSADVLRRSKVFDIELPLSDFQPFEARFGDAPTGKELVEWWCSTSNETQRDGKWFTKLEITSVELVEQLEKWGWMVNRTRSRIRENSVFLKTPKSHDVGYDLYDPKIKNG